MRLLIVEDDRALARGITKVFRDQGFAVDHAAHGKDALELVKLEPYDAVVLDLGLPDMDGLAVLKAVRQSHASLPVLILTARDATSDRVKGLDQGADDYLSKPFAIAELEARVRALMRRGLGNPESVLTLGNLKLDRTTGAAYLNEQLLELTRRERAVLESLAVRVGNVVSRDRLAANVFSFDDMVAPNALEVYVGRLRRKLESGDIEIVTVRGLGYLLRVT